MNDFDDDVDCAMVLMRVSLFTRRRPNGEKRRVELFSFQPVVVYVVSSLLETKRTLVVLFSSSRHHQEERTRRLERRNSLKREKRYDTGEGRDHPKKGRSKKSFFVCVFLPLQNTRKRRKKEKTDPCRCIRILLFPTDDDDNNRPQQIAAAGAAAVMLFNSAPAHAEIMGLTLQNGVPNAAAQKFVQPFVPDGRPVVYVEKDGAADITTKEGRIAPNVARSNVGCKTITGQPCVDFVSGK